MINISLIIKIISVATNGGIIHRIIDANERNLDAKENPFIRNISEGNISIVGLKRRVGLISGTALIVGTMIGKKAI